MVDVKTMEDYEAYRWLCVNLAVDRYSLYGEAQKWRTHYEQLKEVYYARKGTEQQGEDVA